jgi:hypothetical protein
LNHDRIYFNKFVKPSESIRRGFNVNSVREDSKLVNLEDNKRIWSKLFDVNDFDTNSSPVTVDDITIHERKHVRKKTVKEKQLLSQQEREKIQRKMEKQFIMSDLFDIESVGTDITPEEYLKNEEWFDKQGL